MRGQGRERFPPLTQIHFRSLQPKYTTDRRAAASTLIIEVPTHLHYFSHYPSKADRPSVLSGSEAAQQFNGQLQILEESAMTHAARSTRVSCSNADPVVRGSQDKKLVPPATKNPRYAITTNRKYDDIITHGDNSSVFWRVIPQTYLWTNTTGR
ncbi:hypothetical protein J6590_013264 [Homalodisca vitripennis]|nr:hypothetical protein J6590_013264 [Homalodisca vitripennis]